MKQNPDERIKELEKDIEGIKELIKGYEDALEREALYDTKRHMYPYNWKKPPENLYDYDNLPFNHPFRNHRQFIQDHAIMTLSGADYSLTQYALQDYKFYYEKGELPIRLVGKCMVVVPAEHYIVLQLEDPLGRRNVIAENLSLEDAWPLVNRHLLCNMVAVDGKNEYLLRRIRVLKF